MQCPLGSAEARKSERAIGRFIRDTSTSRAPHWFEIHNFWITILTFFWHRPHICHRYHRLYPWRKICHVEKFQISVNNLNNLWSFIEIYAVFVLNLCGENLCGEKMTNMRSDFWFRSNSQVLYSNVPFLLIFNPWVVDHTFFRHQCRLILVPDWQNHGTSRSNLFNDTFGRVLWMTVLRFWLLNED